MRLIGCGGFGRMAPRRDKALVGTLGEKRERSHQCTHVKLRLLRKFDL